MALCQDIPQVYVSRMQRRVAKSNHAIHSETNSVLRILNWSMNRSVLHGDSAKRGATMQHQCFPWRCANRVRQRLSGFVGVAGKNTLHLECNIPTFRHNDFDSAAYLLHID